MRKIELDFVTPSAFGKPLGLLLMLVGVAAAVASALDAAAAIDAQQTLEARKAIVSRAARGYDAADAPKSVTRPEDVRALREALEVASRLKTPWQRLFDETAQAAGADIALTGLQPNPESRTVRIAGLARDLPAANRFVANLLGKPGFAGAYLAQHDTQPKDTEAPLGFIVLATWREEIQ